ncbi:hypothetical protein KVT40_006197 [Elsinoe batatas]|uniref:Myb-like domain-containing protein n=1 Tax=Elsinoe batatas TaxID=2601811 RepID=A0A8K0KX85_9PEZI|nr:hypothetical protein KVT40_006197 [Elsinoe batatas]
MASYIKAIRLARAAPHNKHRDKDKCAMLADLLVSPTPYTNKPDSKLYLIQSKDGRPLNPRTLAAKAGYIEAAATADHSAKSTKDKKKDESDKKKHEKHRSSSPSKEDKSKSSAEAKADSKKDKKNATAPKDDADKTEDKWTAEQDAKLIEMKTGDKTWKDISEDLGKPKWAVTARWKEIDPAKNEAGDKGKGEGNKPKENSGKTDQKPTDEKNEAANNSDADTWTPEQDAKLIELKAANKSWKDIATEMSKPRASLTARWKEINPATTDAQNKDTKDTNTPSANAEKKTPEHQQSSGADHLKQSKPSKPQPLSSPPPAPSPSGPRANEPLLTLKAYAALLSEDAAFFSHSELNQLWDLRDEADDEGKWERLASGFYDATGRRVHEGDVRGKVERMLGLG